MQLKCLIFTIFLFFAFGARSQTYTFSVQNGTYTNLTGSTSLNNDFTWDDPFFVAPIGFDFPYFNTTLSELYFGLGLGGMLTSDSVETGVVPFLIPYGADIIDRGYDVDIDEPAAGALSNISYKTEGNPGARIFKLEWNNVGFFSDLFEDGVSTDFTNFQMWLYEATGDIEIHSGPGLYTQPQLDWDLESGPWVSLLEGIDLDNEELEPGSGALILEGPAASPDMVTLPSVINLVFLVGPIPDGTIYRFSRTSSGVKDPSGNQAFEVAVTPNPVSDQLQLTFSGPVSDISTIQIADQSGKILKSFTGYQQSIGVADLAAGNYVISILNNAGQVAARSFMKK